ncbi:MAG: hypothetical protein LUG45_00950 [Clostridiales bacterium]|nr:hypothetical protein [Clostridiales bacterium]
MVVTVTSANLETLDLNPTDETAEIAQNIAVLIATPKGDVPLRRDIGVDTSYLNRPHKAALAAFESALTEAADLAEKRADIVGVTDMAGEGDGTIAPKVEVRFNG